MRRWVAVAVLVALAATAVADLIRTS